MLIYLSPFFSSGNATNFLKKLGHIPHLADGFLGVLLKKMSFHCQEFPVNWELDQMWAYSGKSSSLGSAGSLASINNKLSHVVCPGLDAPVRKFPINLSLTGLSKAIFIYLQLCWVFVAERGLFSICDEWGLFFVAVHGLLITVVSSVAEQSSRLEGFSSCSSQALERGLSSCGARAWLPLGMWNLPKSGIVPVSPALAGKFLSTVPPGKSLLSVFFIF